MTVRIELPSDIEASLVAQAQAQGMALPQYVEALLRHQAKPAEPTDPMSPAKRALAWREGTKNLPHTPPLSDEAISRESLYDVRG